MTDTTRRAVVLGAGGAGLAVALSACAGYSTGGGTTAAEPAAEPTATETKGAGDGGEAKGSGDAPAAAAIAQAGDIPKGGGKILESEKIVITQPADGEFKAFSAVCTHQGCTVASVSNGTINCPCHGSKFNLDGTVANGPATKPLEARTVTVQGDSIILG